MTSTIGQSNQGTRRENRRQRRTNHFALLAACCRSRGWVAVALAALVVQGCPVYEDYCDSRSDCAPGYRCNPYTGDCELTSYGPGPECAAPAECGPGETCGQSGECLPGSCVFHGCVSGYRCSVVDGLHSCTARSETGGPGAMDAGSALDAGSTLDASLSGDAGGAPPDAGGAGDAATDAAP